MCHCVSFMQLNKRKIIHKETVYLEGHGVYGTGTELVIVQEQVLQVFYRSKGVSWDAVNSILF